MSNNGGHLTVQYNLRWSEEMRDKVAAAAKDNTRSMNQEIIARLEQTFITTYDDVQKIPTEVLMMELASRMQGYSLKFEQITANKS